MCDMIPMLSYLFRQRKGGAIMSLIISLVISVAASVIAYYICKWLDRD